MRFRLSLPILTLFLCLPGIITPVNAQSSRPRTIDNIQFGFIEPWLSSEHWDGFGGGIDWKLVSPPHTPVMSPYSHAILSDAFDITWKAARTGGYISCSAQANKGALKYTINCDFDTSRLTKKSDEYTEFLNSGERYILLPNIEDDPIITIKVDYDVSLETHNQIKSVKSVSKKVLQTQSTASVWGVGTELITLRFDPRDRQNKRSLKTKRTFHYHASINLRSFNSKGTDENNIPCLDIYNLPDINGGVITTYRCNLVQVMTWLIRRDKDKIVTTPPLKPGSHSMNVLDPEAITHFRVASMPGTDARVKATGIVTFTVDYPAFNTSKKKDE